MIFKLAAAIFSLLLSISNAADVPSLYYNCFSCLFLGNYYCPLKSTFYAGYCDTSSFFTCPSQLKGSFFQCTYDFEVDISQKFYFMPSFTFTDFESGLMITYKSDSFDFSLKKG